MLLKKLMQFQTISSKDSFAKRKLVITFNISGEQVFIMISFIMKADIPISKIEKSPKKLSGSGIRMTR